MPYKGVTKSGETFQSSRGTITRAALGHSGRFWVIDYFTSALHSNVDKMNNMRTVIYVHTTGVGYPHMAPRSIVS